MVKVSLLKGARSGMTVNQRSSRNLKGSLEEAHQTLSGVTKALTKINRTLGGKRGAKKLHAQLQQMQKCTNQIKAVMSLISSSQVHVRSIEKTNVLAHQSIDKATKDVQPNEQQFHLGYSLYHLEIEPDFPEASFTSMLSGGTVPFAAHPPQTEK